MLIVAILAFIINNVLPYALLQPQRITTPNYLEIEQQNYTRLSFLTRDSIVLKGYHVKSNKDTIHGAVILVHGIGGCKEHFTKLAIDLANNGYDSWLFDNKYMERAEECTLLMVIMKKTIFHLLLMK